MPVLSNSVDDETPPTGAMSDTGGFAQQLGPLEVTRASPVRLHSTPLDSSVQAPTPPPRDLTTTPVPGSVRAVKLPQVPGFVLSGELGRGGMGVVYRAKQIRLNRVVALKMLLHADTADLVDIIRFRSEAEAVAAVKHPHVVQVHEFGHVDGKPYFAMEFLAGGTLHNRIRTLGKSDPLPAAQLVEKLARAVQAAHSEGIVHRDLKPGNILFDELGEPRVTDFGLAKRFSMQLTNTQAVMGTPAYMSPEQASGRTKFVGPPSDIYSLGVILYECLTGKPPFDGADSITVIQQVLNDTPSSIRSQVRTVPRDLELICLKCLEKEPADRYPTAAALAEDLSCFLAGQPVQVRPAGPLERSIKWARRHPTIASVYALSALVLVITTLGLGIIGLWWEAVGARDEADRNSHVAELAKADAEAQRGEAEESRDRLTGQNREISNARKSVEDSLVSEKVANAAAQTSAQVAREATGKAEAAKQSLETISYLRDVGFANLESQRGNVLRARQLLDNCPENRRDWEWWHAYRVAHKEAASGSTNAVATDIAFSGKSVDVTTVDEGGVITPFDMDVGRGLPKSMIPGNEEHLLSRLSENASRLLTVRSRFQKAPDIATVWNTKTGKPVGVFPATGQLARSAAISGNGEKILIGYAQPHHLTAYDVATGKELGTLEGFCPAERTGLNRDGTRAISAIAHKRDQDSAYDIVVWDTATGKILAKHTSKLGFPIAMALDADGTTAVIGYDTGALLLYDVRTQKAIESEKAHTGSVLAVAITRDGQRVASSGDDGIVRICEAQTGVLEQNFRGHTRRVLSVKFDSTGELVASTDVAQRFFVWIMKGTKQAIAKLDPPAEMKGQFVMDQAGKRCISYSESGHIHIWELRADKHDPITPPTDAKFATFAIDPKGTRFAGADDRGTIYLWDQIATVAHELPKLESTKLDREIGGSRTLAVETLAFSADGTRLLATDGWRISVFDTTTRKQIFTREVRHTVACISDDGQSAAAGSLGQAFAWRLDSDSSESSFTFGSGWLSAIALSRDGTVLALGTRDWDIFLFDVRNPDTKEETAPKTKLEGHITAVRSLAFHSKGHRLVSGADDGSIKVWDTESGQEAISINIFVRVPIRRIFFSNGSSDIIVMPDKCPPFNLHGGTRRLVVPPRH